MNLNEVEKHVKFDLILQLLLHIAIGLAFILSLIVILATPAKAQEQTTDITNSIKTNYDCPWGYNSSGYCAIQTNNGGGVRSFNTRYNGVLNAISFAFPYYFNQNSNNEIIDIYSTTNDFRNNNINVYCYSYETSPSQSNSRSCSLRFISQKHIQIVFPYDSLQWHEIILASNNAITGVSNYLIQKVTLTYDDGQQDLSGIIDNATSNTTDIINNNNANATETQNAITGVGANIINELANICNNLINFEGIATGVIDDDGTIANVGGSVTATPSTGVITYTGSNAWYGFHTDYINIDSSLTYYINYNFQGGKFLRIGYYNSSLHFISTQDVWSPSDTVRLSIPLSASVIRISISNYASGVEGFTIEGLRLNTNNYSYCPYGTSRNKLDVIGFGLDILNGNIESTNDKLDEQTDLQQQQNDYLMDDTNPSVDTNGIDDVMSSVEITDPLNYLLTLPISLLQKLNTVLSANSCSRVSFGSLYNTELYLPCINFEQLLGSNIWGTIDLIVGVGLLAIIFKRFYNSISNVLTLGKEKEVRDKLDLPTPMQFLASILGGGRD